MSKRLAVCQNVSGYSIARNYAAASKILRIDAGNVLGDRDTARLVVAIYRARIEPHDIAELVGDDRHRIFDVQAAAESVSHFVERVDFLVSAFDLVDVAWRAAVSRRRLQEPGGGNGARARGRERRERPIRIFNLLFGYDRFEVGKALEKKLDHLWIELSAGGFPQKLDRLFSRQPSPVLPVFVHRIETIDDRKDSRRYRYFVFLERVGITGAVPALVMVTHDRHHRIRESDSLQNLSANDRMNLHLLEFRGGQLAGLVENMIGNGQLADVVKQRADLQRLYLSFGEMVEPRQSFGINLYPSDVAVRRLVLGVYGACQRFDRRKVKAADFLDVPRLLVDMLEVDLVGQIRCRNHRHRRRDVDESVSLDCKIDETRRQHTREEGPGGPEIPASPE